MTSAIPPSTPPGATNVAVEVKSVDAARGATWWSEAWALFTRSPGAWIGCVVILFAIFVAVKFVPFVGPLALNLVSPVFTGGLMLGCRAIKRGEKLRIEHLFAGFSERVGALMMIGVIYTLGMIVIAVVVFGVLLMFFGFAVVTQLWNLQDAASAGLAVGSALFAILIGMLVFLLLVMPLVMGVWFAPALVVLRGMSAGAAMRASFAGSLKNVVPFLVYGVLGVVLAFLATIPLALGWLVLAPMFFASVYAGYEDIFDDRVAATLTPASTAMPPTRPL